MFNVQKKLLCTNNMKSDIETCLKNVSINQNLLRNKYKIPIKTYIQYFSDINLFYMSDQRCNSMYSLTNNISFKFKSNAEAIENMKVAACKQIYKDKRETTSNDSPLFHFYTYFRFDFSCRSYYSQWKISGTVENYMQKIRNLK